MGMNEKTQARSVWKVDWELLGKRRFIQSVFWPFLLVATCQRGNLRRLLARRINLCDRENQDSPWIMSRNDHSAGFIPVA